MAFRLGGEGQDYRISDDGEPAGSAGQPIYNQLLSLELTYILVVVIRYFGGTKLGIPGLINAYKTATYDALNEASIKVKILMASYKITTSYDHSAQLMNAFQSMDFEVVDVAYEAFATFYIKLPLEDHEAQIELSLAKGLNLPAVEMVADIDSATLSYELLEVES